MRTLVEPLDEQGEFDLAIPELITDYPVSCGAF